MKGTPRLFLNIAEFTIASALLQHNPIEYRAIQTVGAIAPTV